MQRHVTQPSPQNFPRALHTLSTCAPAHDAPAPRGPHHAPRAHDGLPRQPPDARQLCDRGVLVLVRVRQAQAQVQVRFCLEIYIKKGHGVVRWVYSEASPLCLRRRVVNFSHRVFRRVCVYFTSFLISWPVERGAGWRVGTLLFPPISLSLSLSLSLSTTAMLLLLGALSVVLLKVAALGLAVQLMARC